LSTFEKTGFGTYFVITFPKCLALTSLPYFVILLRYNLSQCVWLLLRYLTSLQPFPMRLALTSLQYFVITFSKCLALTPLKPFPNVWLLLRYNLFQMFGSYSVKTFSKCLAPPFLKVDKGG